jgi:hypothetical protein
MKWKFWIVASVLFAGSSISWGAYVISNRAFLRDFNDGVQAYITGRFEEAEAASQRALRRRPRSLQAKELLVKVLVERGYADYHSKNYPAAVEALNEAAKIGFPTEAGQEGVRRLQRLLAADNERPQPVEKVLQEAFRGLPDTHQPASVQYVLEQWMRRSQMNQESLFARYHENQERWLDEASRERSRFQRTLYAGLAFFGLGGTVLLMLGGVLLHAYFGRRGVFAQLLENHYQRVAAVLPPSSAVLLGPPMHWLADSKARQIDAIETEIVADSSEEARKHLQPFLDAEDPWMQARAAKILHRWDRESSLALLKRLVGDVSSSRRVPGMWALAELATVEALDLLAPLALSAERTIQEGAIRCLLQLQAREELPVDARRSLQKHLTEIRSRTGWIF